jgi:hypothetical protein
MARVHQQTARKDYPDEGITKGSTYYKWTLRPGGPGARGRLYRSATYPKPWQLTSSAFLQQQYQIEDQLQNLEDHEGDLASVRDDIVAEIQGLMEETQGSLDNMPESLQYSPTGEMLQERIDGCEAWVSELEAIEIPERELSEPLLDTDEPTEEQEDEFDEENRAYEEQEEAIASALEELQGCAYPG